MTSNHVLFLIKKSLKNHDYHKKLRINLKALIIL